MKICFFATRQAGDGAGDHCLLLFFSAFFREFEQIAAATGAVIKAIRLDPVGRWFAQFGRDHSGVFGKLQLDLVTGQKTCDPYFDFVNGNKGLTIAGQTFNISYNSSEVLFFHLQLLFGDFRALQPLISRHAAEQRSGIIQKVGCNAIASFIDEGAWH